MIRWLLLLLLVAGPASAQDYPSRPIRILEPLAAGSAVDVVTRIVADRMGRILGGSLFVENQPGAAGLLGMRAGSRAAPDGYTVLAVNDSVVTVLPNIRSDAGYDPRTAFAPVVQLVRIHWALVASPSLKADTLAGFIAAAKAKPGVIDFASGGQGSPQHIAMELFERAAGIKLQHVPFRGATPALNEVVADHIPVMFTALPTPLPFLDDKRLVILGIADPARLPTLPNVPTLAEAGLPGFAFSAWGALLVPAGTPPAIIDKLNAAANQALADPEVKKQLTDLGYEVVGGPPSALKTLIDEDFKAKGDILRAANIHAD
ncbi:MAG: tripartite tricarboxylate transporter substrate binding protein [Acetobacteraceae bacterium]|nr:tripartite tricarboxylate transporter substrate binding protein [Acetobacteraceae bacterium]